MLPEEIIELRQRLEFSVSQLAKELKVEVRLILDWEAGRKFPTRRHVRLLQRYHDSETRH